MFSAFCTTRDVTISVLLGMWRLYLSMYFSIYWLVNVFKHCANHSCTESSELTCHSVHRNETVTLLSPSNSFEASLQHDFRAFHTLSPFPNPPSPHTHTRSVVPSRTHPLCTDCTLSPLPDPDESPPFQFFHWRELGNCGFLFPGLRGRTRGSPGGRDTRHGSRSHAYALTFRHAGARLSGQASKARTGLAEAVTQCLGYPITGEDDENPGL